MKAWMIALLLALALTGCASGDPAREPTPAQGPGETQTAAAPALSASQTERQPRPLMESEVLDAYDRAVSVYSWFDLAPPPCTQETVLENGTLYYQVDSLGLSDLDDLRTYLRSLFSEDLSQDILALGGETPLYIEVDGALYTAVTARARDREKGQVQVEVLPQSDTLFYVDVTVELLDVDGESVAGMEYWEFPYAFTDGRWCFTEFQLVY